MAAKPEVMMEDMWTVCGEVQTLHKLSDTELPSVGALSATTHRTCIEIGARTKGAYGSQVRGDTGTGSAQYRARLVPGTSMEGGRRGAHGYQYASCLLHHKYRVPAVLLPRSQPPAPGDHYQFSYLLRRLIRGRLPVTTQARQRQLIRGRGLPGTWRLL